MDIPKIITETALKHGFNCVDYIGYRKGKQAFALGRVEEDGSIAVGGLPLIYLYDGKSIEVVSGTEGLELL